MLPFKNPKDLISYFGFAHVVTCRLLDQRSAELDRLKERMLKAEGCASATAPASSTYLFTSEHHAAPTIAHTSCCKQTQPVQSNLASRALPSCRPRGSHETTDCSSGLTGNFCL